MGYRKLPSLSNCFWPLAMLVALVVTRPLLVASASEQEASAEATAAPKNAAELKALESQTKKLVAQALLCTVGVRIGSSQGSGVIVSEDGYVMTAGHVAKTPNRPVTFLFADGKTAKGKTLGVLPVTDAGLMKITDVNTADEGKWPFAEKGCSAELKIGDWCMVVGHPLGYQKERPPVIRIGRVLVSRDTVIQTDCTLVAGDSGGPLFDLQGKVIGINSRINESTKLNFHIPVDAYRESWDRLANSVSWLDGLPGRDSDEVKAAFRQVIAAAGQCTARVKCDGRDAALGTVAGPDGWILTKASELRGKIVCRLRDGREIAASIVGIHQPTDLAMLKIDAQLLPAIEWNRQKPSMGQWVAAAGLADEPLGMGVVSIPEREIPPISGVLGVMLKDASGMAQVAGVVPNSPASKADLKGGDFITHIDGKAVGGREELVEAIRRHRIGAAVKLKVKRGDKEFEISVKLGKISSPSSQKRDMQNRMGVGISRRRDAFPIVLQHDTVVRPVDCGGPLVDLDGKVLGVNIARGGRTETYCLPTETLLPLMYELMSGRLTPPDIKRQREKKAEEEKKRIAEEKQKKAEQERKKAEEEKRKAEQEKKRIEEENQKKAEQEKKRIEE